MLASKRQGWLLQETLVSLLLFAVILTLLYEQTQSHWQALQTLEQTHTERFQQQQINRLRLLKQDKTWLVGQWSVPTTVMCDNCSGDALSDWALSWLGNGQDELVLEAF